MDGNVPARPAKTTAALVMLAKAPIPGQVKTPLCPALTEDEAATLHGSFVLDTLERTKRAASTFKLPIDRFLACAPSRSHVFFRIMEARHGVTLLDQQGDDLGERMHRIFDRLLTHGFDDLAGLSPTNRASLERKADGGLQLDIKGSRNSAPMS